MLPLNLVTAAIIVKDQNVLLVHNKKIGKWGLLGGVGAWENTTDPLEAVVLEVRGDVGCRFEGEFYTMNYSCHPTPTITLFYEGRIDGQPKPVCQNITEAQYFSFEEVLALDLAYDHRVVLEKYISAF